MSNRFLKLLLSGCALCAYTVVQAYDITGWWPDEEDIVMDNVLRPWEFAAWAEDQMAEWNEVDTTNNSHPFQINRNPEHSFGSDDGDNTIGFLDEAGLQSEYGVLYRPVAGRPDRALAWTVCESEPEHTECDVMFDPSRTWVLEPDGVNSWFQPVALHELTHVRGLHHFNSFLAIMNTGAGDISGDTLYMDDKEGVREHASHVTERDITIYPKWHDGQNAQWMSMDPFLILHEGDTIQFKGITVENRGTLPFDGPVRFGVYLSKDMQIDTTDQLLNTGTFTSFPRFIYTTFDWSAQIPPQSDCSTRYIGGIIDDNNAWAERYEDNNSVAFVPGYPAPGQLSLLLAKDAYEPDNDIDRPVPISLPFQDSDLSIDTDEDIDHYQVTLTTGGTLHVRSIYDPSKGVIRLFLRDSDGDHLSEAQLTGFGAVLLHPVQASSYHILVNDNQEAGSCNRYQLKVELDDTPPQPNPMTWATAPHATGTTEICMEATSASDDSPPVEYYHAFWDSATGGTGGHSSDWGPAIRYCDAGLQPNHEYQYKVQARDRGGIAGDPSPLQGAYTRAEVPGAEPFSDITSTSIRMNWNANGNPGWTEYFAENLTAGTYSGWTTATSWESTGLAPDTGYHFVVMARNGDGVPTAWTNLSTQRTTPAPRADLGITKTDSLDPILLGAETIAYTVTVTNHGPDAASGIRVTDILPPSLRPSSITVTQGICRDDTPLRQLISCDLGALAAGATAQLALTLNPTSSGTIQNSVSVSATETDPVTTNNSASASTFVVDGIDLSLDKTDHQDRVVLGNEIQYTLVVTNNSPRSATNVVVNDTLPPGVTFVKVNPEQGSCRVLTPGIVGCYLGTVANGHAVSIGLNVSPLAVGTVTNTAKVTASEPDTKPANNTASETTTVILSD